MTSREIGLDETAMSVAAQRDCVMKLANRANGRLHFLENDPSLASYSSSQIRDAIAAGNFQEVSEMLPECLHDFVKGEGLYCS